jgi:hypothetical protein
LIDVDDVRCGGFRILYDPDARVRMLPGERKLPSGAADSVLRGLNEAPHLYTQALRVQAPQRPWERVEVSVLPNSQEVQGEALEVGLGCIRLQIGERASAADVEAIARHEALHLLLAAGLPSGAKWEDPELAFADWIVRAIEALREDVPRLPKSAPILEKLPRSRLSTADQSELRISEAALGTHFLEAAAALSADAGGELTAIVLDDWLCDYEQYARGIGSMPSGAGKLWRLSETGFARDPLVRLSAAATALACDDRVVFAGEKHVRADEPVVWKSRGRVRVPILWREARPRPAPIFALRAVAQSSSEALALLEEAARGGESLEVRALWPRVLRKFASWPMPSVEPGPLPRVQPLDEEAHRALSQALQALQSMSFASWLPQLQAVRPLTALPDSKTSTLLVSSSPLDVKALVAIRTLAAQRPIRGAIFSNLQNGAAHERAPDLPPPLDPRYREEVCASFEDLLLSMTAPGIVATM